MQLHLSSSLPLDIKVKYLLRNLHELLKNLPFLLPDLSFHLFQDFPVEFSQQVVEVSIFDVA